MRDIELKNNERILWVFTVTHDGRLFTVYANGKKSFTSTEDTAPDAMKEYFENWDTPEVVL